MGRKSLMGNGVLNWETPISELGLDLTPNSEFFVRSHFPVPPAELSTWVLRVDGAVKSPRVFTYEDLTEMKQETVVTTLECAGNGRTAYESAAPGELRWGVGAVGTATWDGVPVSVILGKVRVTDAAKELVGEGADSGFVPGSSKAVNYQRGLPLKKALAKGTLIALKMNGRVLPPEHGYPARLVVPGWYGMASVKWLSRLTLRSGEPFAGYYNATKYVYVEKSHGQTRTEPVTQIRVKSLVTAPADGESLPVGKKLTIRGKAWSGAGRVERVEVDVGEGWRAVKMTKPVGRFAWTSWVFDWRPLKKGVTAISTRATDREGNTQPRERPQNVYQYGCNSISQVHVKVV